MENFKVKASNIKCGGCASNIQNGLAEMDGIKNIEVDIATGEVQISGEQLNQEKIRAKLAELGYPEVK